MINISEIEYGSDDAVIIVRPLILFPLLHNQDHMVAGSAQELMYGVDKRMFLCKYVDNCTTIQKIGNVYLIPGLVKTAYTYFNSIDELLNYYSEEIPIRIKKRKNAEKFPDLAFVSKHLIKMRNITTEIPNHIDG